MSSARVVIVGAGISGLALAYRIIQLIPQAEITILEERDRPGGTVWTEEIEGFRVELGPNGFLGSKPSTLQLCQDLGIADHLIPASEAAHRKRYLFWNGKLRRLPSGISSFFSTELLTLHGKLAILAEPFRRRRREQDDESVDAFVRRRLGNEAADIFGDALVTGIYAGDPSQMSARAAFPRMVELEERHGSLLRGMLLRSKKHLPNAATGDRSRGTLWSFRDGLRFLIERLIQSLPKPPIMGVTVQHLERSHGGWTVYSKDGQTWQANVLVLTCPAYRQAELMSGLDPGLAAEMKGIAYNRLAVVAIGYMQSDIPAPLDGFGFIAPQRLKRDILGAQWCSSIFPDRAPSGHVLMRAMCGGWNRPEILDWSDEQIRAAVRSELQAIMGITAAPILQRVVRCHHAIPQYSLGHLERVARIERRLADQVGLFVGGNAYLGVALNDCTAQAVILGRRVSELLARRPQ